MLTTLSSTVDTTPTMIDTNIISTISVYLLLAASIGVALVGAIHVPREPNTVRRHALYRFCIVSATMTAAAAVAVRAIAWTLGAEPEPFALGQTAWYMLGGAASLTLMNTASWGRTLPRPNREVPQPNVPRSRTN